MKLEDLEGWHHSKFSTFNHEISVDVSSTGSEPIACLRIATPKEGTIAMIPLAVVASIVNRTVRAQYNDDEKLEALERKNHHLNEQVYKLLVERDSLREIIDAVRAYAEEPTNQALQGLRNVLRERKCGGT